MEIRISIQTTRPLTGAAMTENEGPLPFAGWLELLQAVSRLVGADVDPAGGRWRPRKSQAPASCPPVMTLRMARMGLPLPRGSPHRGEGCHES